MSKLGLGLGLGLALGSPCTLGQGGGVVPQPLAPLILTKTPTHAFSSLKLVSYNGPFGKDENAADMAFDGNTIPSTVASASGVYDQITGLLLATQPNAADRPHVNPTYGKFGRHQGLMFDGANSGVSLGRARELILDPSISLPSQDHTVIHVVQNVTGNAASILGSLGNPDPLALDPIVQLIFQGQALSGEAMGTVQTFSAYPPCVLAVFGFGADASNTRLNQADRVNNRTKPATAINTAGGKIGHGKPRTGNLSAPAWAAGVLTLTTSVAHGLTVGSKVFLAGLTSANGVQLNGEFTAVTGTTGSTLKVAVASDPGTVGVTGAGFYNNLRRGTFRWLGSYYYTPALTPAEYNVARAELEAAFGIQSIFDTQLVYEGDSNTEGTCADNCRVAPVRVQGSLRKAARVHNFANFGNTAQAVATLGAGRYSIAAAGWTQASRLGIIGLGTNDVIGNRTDAQIIADLQTIVNSMVGVGITQVQMRTIPPASSITAGKETVRQAVNTAIRSGTITGLAAYIEMPNETPASDGLHWSSAQQDTIAANDGTSTNALTW